MNDAQLEFLLLWLTVIQKDSIIVSMASSLQSHLCAFDFSFSNSPAIVCNSTSCLISKSSLAVLYCAWIFLQVYIRIYSICFLSRISKKVRTIDGPIETALQSWHLLPIRKGTKVNSGHKFKQAKVSKSKARISQ